MNPEKLNLNRNAAKQGFSGAQGIIIIILVRLTETLNLNLKLVVYRNARDIKYSLSIRNV